MAKDKYRPEDHLAQYKVKAGNFVVRYQGYGFEETKDIFKGIKRILKGNPGLVTYKVKNMGEDLIGRYEIWLDGHSVFSGGALTKNLLVGSAAELVVPGDVFIFTPDFKTCHVIKSRVWDQLFEVKPID